MTPEEIELDTEQKKLLAIVAENAKKPWPDVFREALQQYGRNGTCAATNPPPQDDKAQMERFLEQLSRQGILVDFKPLPATAGKDEREPITVAGPPVSERIIADRR